MNLIEKINKFHNITEYHYEDYNRNINNFSFKPIIHLALNENPYGPSRRIATYFSTVENLINRYPDSNASTLKRVLSSHYSVSEDCILASNGIDELLLLIAISFLEVGDRVLSTESSFYGYEAAVNLSQANGFYVPLDKYEINVDKFCNSITEYKPVLVFLCNPHNPTGSILKYKELEKICQIAHKNNAVLICDEAYAEFAEPEFYSAINMLKRYNNIIVLRTFSKAYGLAGLRCGYAIGERKLICHINKIKHILPYNVNAVAQAVSAICINDQQHLQFVCSQNLQIRKWFANKLDLLGLYNVPSHTNFLLVKIPFDSKSFCAELLQKYKISIKDATSMGFENHVRISIGLLEEMERLYNALKDILINN